MTAPFDTPWKIRNHLERILLSPVARLQFAAAGVKWGRGFRIFGTPIIQRHAGSTIQLGDNISLRSNPRSNPLAPAHPVVLSTRARGARIVIGQDCGLTGARVVAATSVTIGDRVLIGSGATICDTDFHPLSPAGRQRDINAGAHAPIIVEDDVFIGMNAIILKGVTLSRGCVVGAGAVVSKDVGPGLIVAGNPAKVIGSTH